MTIKSPTLRIGTALLLLVAAIWLAWPDRNQYGNSSMEERLTSCTTASGTTFRLYRGNGGATVAYWYTVTSESGLFEREKQIFFAYAAPELSSISCDGGQLKLHGASLNESFSDAQIHALRTKPITYWKGKLEDDRGSMQLPAILQAVLAAGLAVAAIVLLFRRKRSSGE